MACERRTWAEECGERLADKLATALVSAANHEPLFQKHCSLWRAFGWPQDLSSSLWGCNRCSKVLFREWYLLYHCALKSWLYFSFILLGSQSFSAKFHQSCCWCTPLEISIKISFHCFLRFVIVKETNEFDKTNPLGAEFMQMLKHHHCLIIELMTTSHHHQRHYLIMVMPAERGGNWWWCLNLDPTRPLTFRL